MSGRHSVDEYPEHLNPFKKRLGLRGSFRELTKTLRRPFKKKNDLVATGEAKHITVGPASRNEQSEVNLRNAGRIRTTQYNSELLPRSRFSERVAQTKSLAPNPFESTEGNPNNVLDSSSRAHDTDGTTSDGNTSMRRKYRRKKRAPLPPNKSGIGTGMLSVSEHNNSKWSINSCDTDCSSYTYYSEAEQEQHEISDLKGIEEISTEIRNYYQSRDDDTDLKVAKMPDIVVSVEEAQTIQTDIAEDKDVVTQPVSALNSANDDEDFIQNSNAYKDIIEENGTSVMSPSEQSIQSDVTDNTIVISNNTDKPEVVEDNRDTDNSAPEMLAEQIAELKISDQQNNNSTNENPEMDINYVQTKSIYIASSRDDIDKFDYNERSSIYISGSRDALDDSAAGDVDDCNNNNDEANKPAPKVRKHKLTKMALLGSSENI